MNRKLITAAVMVIGGLFQLHVQGAPLLLKSGSFDPSDARVMARRAPLKALATKPAKGGERVYIVQKDGLVDAAWRTALTGAGAKILRYLPENAYLVRATAEAAARRFTRRISSSRTASIRRRESSAEDTRCAWRTSSPAISTPSAAVRTATVRRSGSAGRRARIGSSPAFRCPSGRRTEVAGGRVAASFAFLQASIRSYS